MSTQTDVTRLARRTFGFEALRPGQEAAIEAIVEGRDTLAVMPTGSGKSAIYQIASLLRKGPTVIVSPLIALQHDQVEAIERHHLGEAAEVNSMIVEQVAEAVEEHDEPIAVAEIHEETGLSATKINAALTRLEEVGTVEALPTGEVMEGKDETAQHEAAEEAVLAQEHHRAFERSRIEMMRGYAEVWDCRREYVLNYFGEAFDAPCNSCDNCDAGMTVAEDEGNEPFPLNSRVRHGVWGEGLVQRYESDTMIVLFNEVGYKTLDIGFVMESGALQEAE